VTVGVTLASWEILLIVSMGSLVGTGRVVLLALLSQDSNEQTIIVIAINGRGLKYEIKFTLYDIGNRKFSIGRS
jgi:hypothetical protein